MQNKYLRPFMANPKVKGVVRVHTYAVLQDALDTGISFALNRADKHADDPLTEAQRERLRSQLEIEIPNAILEYFSFE
jgi:hypothetical protein